MVTKAALDAGLTVADGVECYIQFGSKTVKELSERNGWTAMFSEAGVKLIDPGCGACIGALGSVMMLNKLRCLQSIGISKDVLGLENCTLPVHLL